jgi:hypothetical protein
MSNNMIARVAALPKMTAPDLKNLWKSLYATEPPPFNKVYFVKRLAYRLQELEYGTDSRPLEKQLETYARQHLDMQGKVVRKMRRASPNRPVSGTRLMREYQGEEHHVTVLHHGFDYRGQRYKSLSSIARVITGNKWSGPLFFGLKRMGGGKS